MTALTLERTQVVPRTAHAAPPFSRLTSVELRKMVDTRSGFWLVVSIVVLSLTATGAVIAFAPRDELTYDTFGAAVGVPMAVVLPIIAVLSVTSEWSQRSGLSTFTLVPHRGRVIGAKAVATLVMGVVSVLVAFAVGALGNVAGAALIGIDPVWDLGAAQMAAIVLAQVLAVFVGFVLGVLVRSSAGAVVGYFVYSFVLPGLSGLLASGQAWWRDVGPWIDFKWASSNLYNPTMTGEHWAQLGTSAVIWLVAPLVVGLVLLFRSEVK
jgi:ABC-2 type transport system permease protein